MCQLCEMITRTSTDLFLLSLAYQKSMHTSSSEALVFMLSRGALGSCWGHTFGSSSHDCARVFPCHTRRVKESNKRGHKWLTAPQASVLKAQKPSSVCTKDLSQPCKGCHWVRWVCLIVSALWASADSCNACVSWYDRRLHYYRDWVAALIYSRNVALRQPQCYKHLEKIERKAKQ